MTQFRRSLKKSKHVFLSSLFVALELFSSALWGQDAKTLFNQGIEAAKRGDNDTAIADFTQVIQLAPKVAVAYADRGHCYAMKKDSDKAIADFNQAIQLDPGDKIFYLMRGCEYGVRKDRDKAIADFTLAIQLDPKDARGYYLRGVVSAFKGDFKQVIEDFEHAAQIDPQALKYAYFQHVLALSYAETGDFDKAIQNENQYLQIPNLNGHDREIAQRALTLYQAHQLPGEPPSIPMGVPAVASTTPRPAPPAANVSSAAVTNAPVETTKSWEPPAVLPAQPNWSWTTSDGKTYENVVVTKVDADSVTITHSLGIAHIPAYQLPPDIRKQLNYP